MLDYRMQKKKKKLWVSRLVNLWIGVFISAAHLLKGEKPPHPPSPSD